MLAVLRYISGNHCKIRNVVTPERIYFRKRNRKCGKNYDPILELIWAACERSLGIQQFTIGPEMVVYRGQPYISSTQKSSSLQHGQCLISQLLYG